MSVGPSSGAQVVVRSVRMAEDRQEDSTEWGTGGAAGEVDSEGLVDEVGEGVTGGKASRMCTDGGTSGGVGFPTQAQLADALHVALAAGPQWMAAFNDAVAGEAGDGSGIAAVKAGMDPKEAQEGRRA